MKNKEIIKEITKAICGKKPTYSSIYKQNMYWTECEVIHKLNMRLDNYNREKKIIKKILNKYLNEKIKKEL